MYSLLRRGAVGCETLEIASDVKAVHQRVVYFYRNRHLRASVFRCYLADGDFRHGIVAVMPAGVRKGSKRKPGQDGVVQEVISRGVRAQIAVAGPSLRDDGLRVGVKAREVFVIIEIGESEPLIVHENNRAAVNSFVNQHLLAAQTVTETLDFVAGAGRKIVAGDEKREAFALNKGSQVGHIHGRADVEKRLVVIFEESEVFAARPV